MINRRVLLCGMLAIAADLLAPAALAEVQRPFLYHLDDYVNPVIAPADVRRLNLDSVTGYSILSLWGTYCEPCVKQIPALNGLYQRWQERVGMLSVYPIGLFTHKTTPLDNDGLEECAQNSLAPKYGAEIVRLITEHHGFSSGRALLEVMAERTPGFAADRAKAELQCRQENIRKIKDEDNPTYLEAQRRNFGEHLQQWRIARKPWPTFPTYVLDDQPTEDLLLSSNQHSLSLPYKVLLHNGFFQRELPPEVPAIEKLLKKML